MEDSKELKNNLDQAASTEEVKQIIAQAGKKLTDDEVGKVAGGDDLTLSDNYENMLFRMPRTADKISHQGIKSSEKIPRNPICDIRESLLDSSEQFPIKHPPKQFMQDND